MNTYLSPLPTEERLRMTSLTIAELCGKEHFHVLRDIRKIIGELAEESLNPKMDGEIPFVFEEVSRKVRGKEECMYAMDELAAQLVVSGYSLKYRFQILREWRFYRAAFHDRKWHSDDVEVQKRVMQTLHDTLDNAVKLDYIKANVITNKAVSNLYGFDRMVMKGDMSRPMLDDRQKILEDFEKLFSVSPDYHWVKEAIYNKYQPLMLEKLNAKRIGDDNGNI
jgi:phage regulator Rha-like protein